MQVIKRDQRQEQFDISKIKRAINNADANLENKILDMIADSVASKFKKFEKISVEDIQDAVEDELISRNLTDVAKTYIKYRHDRSNAREFKTELFKIISELNNSKSTDMDLKRENANINADTAAGAMLKYGSELAKTFNLKYLIRPEVADAHRKGEIHIHDLDYYAFTLNCLFIPLGKLLKNGFNTGHGSLRSPQGIQSAAALAAIALQANQNEMFGGQAFPTFDWDLAPYVAKTFIKELAKEIQIVSECPEKDVASFKNTLQGFYDSDGTLIENKQKIVRAMKSMFLLDDPEKVYQDALKSTWNLTFQAMEAFCHNMNSLQSRAGNQTPFSSINYGTCTSPEGRMIIKAVLETTMNGLGHSETQIFPIQIFKCLSGVSYDEGDPNYDLFQLAIKCSAKRLFPNFSNLNVDYNHQYYKEGRPETEVAVMGCARGNETITYKIGDEIFDNISFKDAFEHLKNHGSAKNTERSVYIELNPDVEILDDGKFVKCIGILKNHNVNNFVQLETANRTLVLTDDHPLDIVNKGRTFVKDICEGDEIYVYTDSAKNIEKITSIKSLDLIEDSYDVETESDTFNLSNVHSHNCRTRTLGNTFDKNHEQVTGRGNFSFTTINLPRIALEVKDVPAEERVNAFFKRFNELIDLSITSLEDRFELISKKHLYNFPFLMGEGLYVTSDKFQNDDTIAEIIKQSTLSVGFCGLAEALVCLIGKHHGESEEAQELGLKIVKHLRDRMDAKAKETGLSWSCFASPAESTAGTFVKKDRKYYGIIKGITDREYYTNSSHVPVYYDTTFAHKIETEAPYHSLCNAGHIGYVEFDGDPMKNLTAYEAVVRYAIDHGMTYFSINTQNDRCPICNYVGPIDDECPRCGFKEGIGVSIERLEKCGCINTVKRNFQIID